MSSCNCVRYALELKRWSPVSRAECRGGGRLNRRLLLDSRRSGCRRPVVWLIHGSPPAKSAPEPGSSLLNRRALFWNGSDNPGAARTCRARSSRRHPPCDPARSTASGDKAMRHSISQRRRAREHRLRRRRSDAFAPGKQLHCRAPGWLRPPAKAHGHGSTGRIIVDLKHVLAGRRAAPITSQFQPMKAFTMLPLKVVGRVIRETPGRFFRQQWC